jgi:uncharacterized protein
MNRQRSGQRPWGRGARLLAAYLVGTAILALVLYQGNRLWLPPALQLVGHPLYRFAFFVTLPAELATLWLDAPIDHHVPARNAAIDSAITMALLLAAKVWLLPRLRPRVRWFLALAAAPIVALGIWGTCVEPSQLQVRTYAETIRDLPAWAEGLTIVQVSDTHYGPYVSLPYLERAVRMADALSPDLVALTGDYVHRTPASIERGIGVLGGLHGRLGEVAVLGNHDHWEGAEVCREAFAATSVALLDGSVLFLGPDGLHKEPASDRIALAGLGDLWEDPTPLDTVLANVPADMPRIVLSHNPDTAENMDSATRMVQGRRVNIATHWHVDRSVRVDLMLAGHTHGGQARIPLLGTPLVPSDFGPRYAGGHVEGPYFPVIVSRGVGMAFLPVRIGVPPEIVRVTLLHST